MTTPTQINYKLPATYIPDAPGATAAPLNPADIKQVNIGIRPKSGSPGVYPLTVIDVTFTADANGVSHEPLAAFKSLAPGEYVPAAQVVMIAGGVSDWSTEGPSFPVDPPKPNPPTAVSAS